MKDKYILAIDQGTTSTRAMLFNKNLGRTHTSSLPLTQHFPQNGWVEHDAEEIFSAVVKTVRNVLKIADITASDIAGIGITNQRETVVVWDRKTAKPVHNAIVWQCRRTASLMTELKDNGMEDMVYLKTGLMLDAYFSASKIAWILSNIPNGFERAKRGEILAGTIDSYLLYRLTNGRVHATDRTNASRTMLYNIHTLCWDDELCSLFRVPKECLPLVYPSGHNYGEVDEQYFGGAIPVGAMVGDQQSALFGQNCHSEGETKNTYGTGCFILMNTGEKAVSSRRGLLTTLTATFDGENPNYALEGSVFIAGAVVQWLRDSLKLINSASETESLALSVPDTGGVYVVPAFVGLGAPHWDSTARGLITGITRATTKEHFVRACLEGIAYQVFDVIHAMERDSNKTITSLKVDGGASNNSFLMQFQSDILSVPLFRYDETERTALGSAWLAGITLGVYPKEAKFNFSNHTCFNPNLDKAQRDKIILGWQSAVLRTRVK